MDLDEKSKKQNNKFEYISSLLEETSSELNKLDIQNLNLIRQKKQVLSVINDIRSMHSKVEKASDVDDLYDKVLEFLTSKLYMDYAALVDINFKTKDISVISYRGVSKKTKGLKLDKNIVLQEVLKPVFVNSKTIPAAFQQWISKIFGYPYFVWYPAVKKDNNIIVLLIGNLYENILTKQPFSEVSLEILGAISSMMFLRKDNITKTQEIISKKEERIDFLAEILKTSPVSVVAADEEKKITYINKATELLYGYKENEIIGKPIDVFKVNNETKKIQKSVIRVIKKGNFLKREVLHKNKNRKEFYVSESIFQVKDKDGNFLSYVAFYEDITDRKNLEDEKLRHSNLEAINKIIVTINHEMNQPLTTICAGAEYIMGNLSKNSPLYKDIKIIYDGAWRLADLIKKITNLKKLETTKYSSDVDMFDLRSEKEQENDE